MNTNQVLNNFNFKWDADLMSAKKLSQDEKLTKTFTISELARLAGVGIETVRFYQRERLIRIPPKHGRGYRSYDEGDVAHLLFIKRTQALGFSLREIKGFLGPDGRMGSNCSELSQRFLEKLREMDERIRTLMSVRANLDQYCQHCDSCDRKGCHILSDLKKLEAK